MLYIYIYIHETHVNSTLHIIVQVEEKKGRKPRPNKLPLHSTNNKHKMNRHIYVTVMCMKYEHKQTFEESRLSHNPALTIASLRRHIIMYTCRLVSVRRDAADAHKQTNIIVVVSFVCVV